MTSYVHALPSRVMHFTLTMWNLSWFKPSSMMKRDSTGCVEFQCTFEYQSNFKSEDNPHFHSSFKWKALQLAPSHTAMHGALCHSSTRNVITCDVEACGDVIPYVFQDATTSLVTERQRGVNPFLHDSTNELDQQIIEHLPIAPIKFHLHSKSMGHHQLEIAFTSISRNSTYLYFG